MVTRAKNSSAHAHAPDQHAVHAFLIPAMPDRQSGSRSEVCTPQQFAERWTSRGPDSRRHQALYRSAPREPPGDNARPNHTTTE